MRFFYEPAYNYARYVPFLPREIHGFVLDKPKRIHDRLVELGFGEFEAPPSARLDLEAVHTAEVIKGLGRSGAVARAAEFGALALFPRWLTRHALVRPQLRAAAGTCAAAHLAASGEWVVNLSGGFHHARPDLVHGFCLVNDVALAVRALELAGHRRRVLVLDLDLHQGDGNVAAFEGRDDVYTASIHQASAFPHPKLAGDYDLGLPDGVEDDDYAQVLDRALAEIEAEFEPELIFYVAGTDPYFEDNIGSWRLSREGLVARDRAVARFADRHGAGLVVLPAGGYSPQSPEIAAEGYAAMAALKR